MRGHGCTTYPLSQTSALCSADDQWRNGENALYGSLAKAEHARVLAINERGLERASFRVGRSFALLDGTVRSMDRAGAVAA
jgi:hypothetical protein